MKVDYTYDALGRRLSKHSQAHYEERREVRLHVVWLGWRHAGLGEQDRRRGWLWRTHHALCVRAGQLCAGGAGGARGRHRIARPARVRRLLPAG
nr:hypothetical protein [Burkholderia diffusa]